MALELRHLRYFVAVAEELHFGRAAARMHMAQPPLSQAIQRLERDLGVLLLRRTTRRVELTAAGAALLEEARALLEQADAAVERVRQEARQESGRLAAGFLGSTVHAVAPPIARAWHTRFPERGLDVLEISLDDGLSGLASGRVDVAFARLPPVELAGFRHEELSEEPTCAVLPVGHPLARRPRLALSELADETWVVLAQYESFTTALAREHGFVPRIADRAHGVQTYLGLVAAGIGIGLMASSSRQMRTGDVVFVPLEGLTTTLVMAWRDEPESPPLLALLDVARAATGDISHVSNEA